MLFYDGDQIPATIYFDMDGTLAMFYSHPECLEKMYETGYFKYLSPYVKMIFAVKSLIKDGYDVRILSACVTPQSRVEKTEWLKTFLPEISQEKIYFCNVGEDKASVIPSTHRAILIDDYSENCLRWEAAGGIAIKFLNEINGKGEKWKSTTIHYDSSPEEIVSVIKAYT